MQSSPIKSGREWKWLTEIRSVNAADSVLLYICCCTGFSFFFFSFFLLKNVKNSFPKKKKRKRKDFHRQFCRKFLTVSPAELIAYRMSIFFSFSGDYKLGFLQASCPICGSAAGEALLKPTVSYEV